VREIVEDATLLPSKTKEEATRKEIQITSRN
jgi:hypothetical protein